MSVDGSIQSEYRCRADGRCVHRYADRERGRLWSCWRLCSAYWALCAACWFVAGLSPDELGQWDMAFGFFTLAAPLTVLGLPGSFGRYVEFFRQRGQLRTLLRRTAIASGILTVCRRCTDHLHCSPAVFAIGVRPRDRNAVDVVLGITLVGGNCIQLLMRAGYGAADGTDHGDCAVLQ